MTSFLCDAKYFVPPRNNCCIYTIYKHWLSNTSSGSIVSHKKEDLVHLLDHWNIQVDNPVSLLDQDTSRHFLHSNNPSHKYKVSV